MTSLLKILLAISLALASSIELMAQPLEQGGFELTSAAETTNRSADATTHDGYRLRLAPIRATTVFADDFESGDTTAWSMATGTEEELPSGAVVALMSADCPDGWTTYAPGAGRTVVGAAEGGTIGGTVGSVLFEQEVRQHRHRQPLYAELGDSIGLLPHAHTWSRFDDSTKVWSSWLEDGSGIRIIDWGNGIDNQGSGFYPLSVKDYPPVTRFWTSRLDQDHSHALPVDELLSEPERVSLPYGQLLLCRKD